MRSERIKCLEPEHKADFSGLNFFWKAVRTQRNWRVRLPIGGSPKFQSYIWQPTGMFSVQNKGFSDQIVIIPLYTTVINSDTVHHIIIIIIILLYYHYINYSNYLTW